MPKRASLPLVVHAAVCILVGCGFLWFGTLEIAPAGDFPPWRPFHTTDQYFRALTGREAGSEYLLQIFAALPEKAPLAIVYDERSNGATFLYYLLAYLAWPKEIRPLPVHPETCIEKLRTLDMKQLSAIVFCGVQPPPGHMGIRVGEDLFIVPRDKEKLSGP